MDGGDYSLMLDSGSMRSGHLAVTSEVKLVVHEWGSAFFKIFLPYYKRWKAEWGPGNKVRVSLVPRPVRKIGEEDLVSTVCACA